MVNQVTPTKEEVKFTGQSFQYHQLVLLQHIGHPVYFFRNVRELIQVFRDTLRGMLFFDFYLSSS